MLKLYQVSSVLSSSGQGPGQVKVRCRSGEGQEGQTWPELYPIFGFHHHHHHPTTNFFLGLDKSDGPRMGLYDLGMVREG